MRNEVMVLLAAVSSIAGNSTCQARTRADLRTVESTLSVPNQIDTTHMIIWNVCIAPKSGSALSIYSRPEKLMLRSADLNEAGPAWNECDADDIDDPRG